MTPVTAAPAVQARLLDLQALDSAIARAHARLARLRADDEVARLQVEQDDARRALEEAEAAAAEADATATVVSERAAATRARRDRTRDRLDAGQGDSRDLVAMQHELETLETLLHGQEDAALEAMGAADEADTARTEARTALEEVQGRLRERTEQVRAEGRTVTVEGRALTARRASLAASLPADLVALYDQARSRAGGFGAVRPDGPEAAAAGVALAPVDRARLTSAAPDAVVQDPETGVILVRVAGSGA